MTQLMRPYHLFDNFDRLHGDWLGDEVPLPREGWMPPVDIRNDDDGYRIELDVPGFQPDQVEVSVLDNVLTIKGQQETREETSDEGYLRRERRHDEFVRRFSLPANAAGNDINASLKDGVLTLQIPVVEQQETRKIQVK